ncbi:MAG: amidase [Chloroflexota bacterium]|nr:amidase [Dehalococcoidia bacterium]MDW8253377.1 amidase [Chloroflexota bacterium]
MTFNDATALAEAIARRALSAHEALQAVLDRIAQWEPAIHAWAYLAPDHAHAAARAIDERLARGERVGPLAGVPVGVKDVIDVAGMPTTNGVPGGRVPPRDAFVVARLRAAGAIIVGKTATAPFAFVDPPATRNPYHLERTPGGSSSGSGAAVGARTVPAALGTQTAGSVLRPASYCGAVGFKPTFGWTGRSGVTPLAPSLDHIGFICRSVRDAHVLFQAMAGLDPDDPACRPPLPSSPSRDVRIPPRLGLVETMFERCDDETIAHTRRMLEQLARAGATIASVTLPVHEMAAVQRIIMWAEAAAVHRDLTNFASGLPTPRLRDNVRIGALLPAEHLLRADRLRRRYRLAAAKAMEECDALIMPTTTSPAGSPTTTGDRTSLAPWSLIGTPAITVPSGLSREGLPLGLQLVGRAGADADLLAVAAWVEAHLAPLPPPPSPDYDSLRLGSKASRSPSASI